MTISSTVSRNDYIGTGVVADYPYTFKIFAATDLQVWTRTTAGVQVQLNYPTDYAVTGVGDEAGGNVTPVTAIEAGVFLAIVRVVDLLQPTSLANQTTFFSRTYESALDYQTMVSQTVNDAVDRTIRVPISVSPTGVSLELEAPLAGYGLVWNGDATALVNGAPGALVAVPGDGRTVVTPSAYLSNNAVYNVVDYGAVPDFDEDLYTGTNNEPYITAAWDACLVTGGTLLFPPGNYGLTTGFVGTYDQPVNIEISGSGAVLYAPGVTGAAFKIVGSRVPHGIVIRGLSGCYIGNSTVKSHIELSGSSYATVRDISVEVGDNDTDFAPIRLTGTNPGDFDSQCFWVTIRRLFVRLRSGGPTNSPWGVKIEGPNNSTHVTDCIFGNCDVGVGFTTDGVSTYLANACLVDQNDFGGCVTAISVEGEPDPGYTITGLRVFNNRVETTDTFFSVTTSDNNPGAESFQPPFLYANYCTNGSVTTWIYNPTDSYISALEPLYYGDASTGLRVQVKGAVSFPTFENEHFTLGSPDGNSGWDQQHLKMAGYHFWIDVPSGGFYMKQSQPEFGTDGTLISPLSALLNSTTPLTLGNSWVAYASPTLYVPTSNTGQLITTPNKASLHPTSSLQLVAKVQLDDYTSTTQYLHDKVGTVDGEACYDLSIDSAGSLIYRYTTDGTFASLVQTNSLATGLADFATKWVRVVHTFDVLGNTTVAFALSNDGAAWTPLGGTTTIAGVSSIFAGTCPLSVGSQGVTGLNGCTGKYFRGDVIADTVTVGTFNPNADGTQGAVSVTASTGEVWTITRTSVVLLIGGVRSPNGLVQLRGDIKDGTTAGGTVIATLPSGWRPNATRYFPCVTGTNGSVARIYITSAGEITIDYTPSSGLVSLDSISFNVGE